LSDLTPQNQSTLYVSLYLVYHLVFNIPYVNTWSNGFDNFHALLCTMN